MTVIDPLPAPIGRLVGPVVGALMARVHRDHGTGTRFGAGVERVTGQAGSFRLTLTDGGHLEAATVVVGIGAVPSTGWLADSGLLVQDGVACDEHGRAAGRGNVWAAGDAARWTRPGTGEAVRAEHWTSAVEQAACVAHNITHPGQLRAYIPAGYVWSDQYDWKIQLAGPLHTAVTQQIIGDSAGRPPRFAAVYRDGQSRLAGAVVVNWPKALVSCRRALASGASAAETIALVEALPAPPAPPVRP